MEGKVENYGDWAKGAVLSFFKVQLMRIQNGAMIFLNIYKCGGQTK